MIGVLGIGWKRQPIAMTIDAVLLARIQLA
jgi:hypothetical protein